MTNKSTIQICPFHSDYLTDAAALFIANFQRLRQIVPVLPAAMTEPERVAAKLAQIMQSCAGLMALQNGELVGYLGWWTVERFRESGRRGAYCPEWAHAAAPGQTRSIYHALYASAAAHWAAAGCTVHAITLLAHDDEGRAAWFWNGFGLAVVDALRPMQPLAHQPRSPLTIRTAQGHDVAALAQLDAEHRRYYTAPPIFMPPHASKEAAEWSGFLAQPANSVWLALDDDRPIGFLQFDGAEFDGVEISRSDDTVCITGAFVQPAHRGQQAAAAMLDAALRDYAQRSMARCAVDFESFNPNATAFWLRHFTPVCYSLMRIPEA